MIVHESGIGNDNDKGKDQHKQYQITKHTTQYD